MAAVVITATWDDRYGECYDCGWPAAFYLPDAYGVDGEPPKEYNKRCAVCAANDACNDSTVRRIAEFFGEDN